MGVSERELDVPACVGSLYRFIRTKKISSARGAGKRPPEIGAKNSLDGSTDQLVQFVL
jgi:hypothetical protein